MGLLPPTLPDQEIPVRIVKLPDGRLRVPVAASDEGLAVDGTETIGARRPPLPGLLASRLHRGGARRARACERGRQRRASRPLGRPLQSSVRPPDSVIAPIAAGIPTSQGDDLPGFRGSRVVRPRVLTE